MQRLSRDNLVVSIFGAILSASLFIGAAVSGAPIA